MAYTIQNTDGSTLLLLADNKIDQAATSLTLVGRNYSGYGEYVNNNFVKLLANFASSAGTPPRSPLKGQLWYDTTAKRVKVYDNGFKAISGAIMASELPSGLSSGDLWFDTAKNQLSVFNGITAVLVGPQYTKTSGEIGWILPDTSIKDIDLVSQKVVLLRSYGETVGAMSTASFRVNSADSTTYFNTSTSTVVAGLTIFGDISYTGRTNNSYLSLTIDLATITTQNNFHQPSHTMTQHSKICDVLEATFPINATNERTTTTNGVTQIGVLPGSECSVFCTNSSLMTEVTQVRKYVALSTGKWDFKHISNSYTATNVVREFVRV